MKLSDLRVFPSSVLLVKHGNTQYRLNESVTSHPIVIPYKRNICHLGLPVTFHMRLCNHQCTHAFCTWHMIYVWQLDGIWPPISWSLAAKMDCGCKWKVVWLSSHLWLGWSYCFIRWPQHLRRLETTCPVSVHLVCNLERASQMARELRGTYFVTKEGDKVGDCRKPVFLSFFFSPLTFSINQSGKQEMSLVRFLSFFSHTREAPCKALHLSCLCLLFCLPDASSFLKHPSSLGQLFWSYALEPASSKKLSLVWKWPWYHSRVLWAWLLACLPFVWFY